MLENNQNGYNEMLMYRVLPMLGLFFSTNLWLLNAPIGVAQTPPSVRAVSAKPTTKKRLYKPRKRMAPKGGITTTATRGCAVEDGSKGKFVALAPVSDVGQTIAAHPTFSWYMPHANPYQLRFELAIADTAETIYQTNLSSQAGMMQLTLPSTEPALTIGQSYYWRVILQCETGSPSSDQLVGGEIERVTLARSTPQFPAQLMQYYAEAGIWYDAFAIATPLERNELLRDLAALEVEAPADKLLKQSAALQQILRSIDSTPTAN
jgi:hypothetical protein